MSSIGIKGIRVESLSLRRKDDGGVEVTASYALISSADRVLAKQSVGGYGGNDMQIVPSPATMKAIDALMLAYRTDVQMVLGIDSE
jgi:hypothetical protein